MRVAAAMYVCVCHAVTSRDISREISQGATTYRELRENLCVGTCCGKCCKDVKAQLREETAGAFSLPGLLQPA
ncbi:(2Fe-2S)-binding protein [Oryzomicrobium terrae]|nr:(2Fe-2S)-binding protein [Oryzomicrobium terrae]